MNGINGQSRPRAPLASPERHGALAEYAKSSPVLTQRGCSEKLKTQSLPAGGERAAPSTLGGSGLPPLQLSPRGGAGLGWAGQGAHLPPPPVMLILCFFLSLCLSFSLPLSPPRPPAPAPPPHTAASEACRPPLPAVSPALQPLPAATAPRTPALPALRLGAPSRRPGAPLLPRGLGGPAGQERDGLPVPARRPAAGPLG